MTTTWAEKEIGRGILMSTTVKVSLQPPHKLNKLLQVPEKVDQSSTVSPQRLYIHRTQFFTIFVLSGFFNTHPVLQSNPDPSETSAEPPSEPRFRPPYAPSKNTSSPYYSRKGATITRSASKTLKSQACQMTNSKEYEQTNYKAADNTEKTEMLESA